MAGPEQTSTLLRMNTRLDMNHRFTIQIILGLCLSLPAVSYGATLVSQTAREIPVAYQVDVVVVGGSTGAVSAAVAAADQGAKVFLAAPHPYLGDDMTATLRLWLEEGEVPNSPLAKEIFTVSTTSADAPHPAGLKYTYKADQPCDSQHPDPQAAMLYNGQWKNVTKDSIQYNDDVNIIFDLHEPQEIDSFRLMCYQYGNYRVGVVDVFTSDDGQQWTKRGSTTADSKQIASNLAGASADLNVKARYVKLFLRKHPTAARILLGEVEIIGCHSEKKKEQPTTQPMPRPMHVKSVLDKALLKSGVGFLYSSYVTDVIRDAKGHPCGVVMANRAGRQAVLAKTIIDATKRARVARLAGAHFRPFPGGTQTLKRVVIGGEMRQGPIMQARTISPPFKGPYPNNAKTPSGEFQVIEYTLQLPVASDSQADWAAADQQARTLTYHPHQQITADTFFQVPPDAMFGADQIEKGQEASPAKEKWEGVKSLPVAAFQPRGVEHFYILGGCADISRTQAAALLRPVALMEMGARLGQIVAEATKNMPEPVGAHLPGKLAKDKPAQELAAKGDVQEILGGVRPGQELPTIKEEARSLPVLGEYDVVVVGGGTAGAPAGVGAARQGAKTLVIEYLCGLGGVSTTGYISRYCDGNCVGYTKEVEGGSSHWVIERRMEWHRNALLKTGSDIWFRTIGCGAFVEGTEVRGVVVATPVGYGVVLAKVVIDATGNADIAAAAGAQCRYTGAQEFALQGTGLPPRYLGATYTNTDYTYVDETDMVDVWRAYLKAKERFADAFDLGQLVDTRERRSIIGDETLTVCDMIAGRTYPDTIQQAVSGYDTHSYTVDTYFLLRHPFRTPLWANVPYRCLLPKGLQGILVSGIGLSAHRDAQPMVRMQPDVQNQGYAAGVAATMASKENLPLRKIDVRALQRHLVEVGNLKESVLTEVDSFPVSTEVVAEAVKKVGPATKPREISPSLAIVLSHPEEALPFLRKAYTDSDGERRLFYAKVLGMLGDGTGLEILINLLERSKEWDQSPHYTINGSFQNWHLVGWEASNLDNTIIAIGRIGDRRAVPALIEKVKSLEPDPAPGTGVTHFQPLDYGMTHYRALTQALSNLRDPRAAKSLASILARDDIRGFAQMKLGKLVKDRPNSDKIGQYRNHAVRELLLARALYLCGDYDGLGEKVLREYAQDLRGHFARHAKAVLNQVTPIN